MACAHVCEYDNAIVCIDAPIVIQNDPFAQTKDAKRYQYNVAYLHCRLDGWLIVSTFVL